MDLDIYVVGFEILEADRGIIERSAYLYTNYEEACEAFEEEKERNRRDDMEVRYAFMATFSGGYMSDFESS